MHARNVAAELRRSIVLRQRHDSTAQIDALEVIVRIPPAGAHAPGAKNVAKRTVISGPARLGDDLDDAAVAVTILRFEGTGLDLNLLDECEIDAGTERTIDWAVHTQCRRTRRR